MRKTDTGERGREEITAAQAPQHGPFEPRHDAGREQGRKTCIFTRRTRFDHLVKMPDGQATVGEPRIQLGNSKGEEGASRAAMRLRSRQPAAQFGNSNGRAGRGLLDR